MPGNCEFYDWRNPQDAPHSTFEKPACRRSNRKEVRQVLLIDDHPIFRKGLSICLQKHGILVWDIPFAAMASGMHEQPDVLLMGISKIEDIEDAAVEELRRMCPAAKILVIIDEQTAALAKRMLCLGILGCINRRKTIEDYLHAINTVCNEEVYFEKELAAQLLTHILFPQPDFPVNG